MSGFYSRDLVLAPGGTRKDHALPAWIKVLQVLMTLVILSMAIYLCIISLGYDWNFTGIWEHRRLFISGWFITLGISVVTLFTSTLLGLIFALTQRQPLLLLRYFSKTLVEIIRASPLIVLIMLIWYGFGGVLGLKNDTRFIAGICILTLFEGAYISEIIRAGIESVSKSQREAALAVGFTTYQTYRYVILPQTVRQILPPLTGQFVSLIKDSSLLYYIGVEELTQNARQVDSQTASSLETYLPLAIGYLLLTLPISLFSRWLERQFRYET